MWKWALTGALALGAGVVSAADDTLARFKGGIGVHPVSNAVPSSNVVRTIAPAGQIWVIDKLDARIRANGHITVTGKGLILAGGNNAGRATGQRVFATLICEAAAPFVEHSTPTTGIALTVEGDFDIDDVLSPAPPFTCPSPMLLIRSGALPPAVASGSWFAVGILSTKD
jgi:hypothetical protein